MVSKQIVTVVDHVKTSHLNVFRSRIGHTLFQAKMNVGLPV